MALHVKAHLSLDGKQQEIRSFSLSEEERGSFTHLENKVKNVFIPLRNKEFMLLWQDDCADLITFSSDEELTEALSSMESGSLKVFVKVIENTGGKAQALPTGSIENIEHTGVFCDGCNKGIIGTSFKCVTCSDFHLCSTCERKELHLHDMVSMKWPQSFSSCLFTPGSWNGQTPYFNTAVDVNNLDQNFGQFWFGEFLKNLNQKLSSRDDHKTDKVGKKEEPTGAMASKIVVNDRETGSPKPLGPVVPKCCKGDVKEETQARPCSNINKGDEKTIWSEKDVESSLATKKDDDAFEKKVKDAFLLMEAMGLTNEGDWLTQLLIAKNFDVGSVINTILPQGRV